LPGTNTLAYQDNNIEKVCKVDFRLNIAIKGTINNITRAEPFVLISIFTGLWMAPRHSAERQRRLTLKKESNMAYVVLPSAILLSVIFLYFVMSMEYRAA
jgi:hypothetical protein